jgi:Flp pilus assembly secretin CpaC
MAYFLVRAASALNCGRALALSVGVAVCGLPAQVLAADIDIVLDQAQLVKLPDRISTIVIGNPLIADVSLQPGNLMVITGKGFGRTNLIALDRAGAVLMEKSLEVRAPSADILVVYRGIQRESYSCTPSCERRITLGDSPGFFDSTIAQTMARSGMAQGAAK